MSETLDLPLATPAGEILYLPQGAVARARYIHKLGIKAPADGDMLTVLAGEVAYNISWGELKALAVKDVPSLATAAGLIAAQGLVEIVIVSGREYTLSGASGRMFCFTNPLDSTFIIPAAMLTAANKGYVCEIEQVGDGLVKVVRDDGVPVASRYNHNATSGRKATAAIRIAPDEFGGFEPLLTGDTASLA